MGLISRVSSRTYRGFESEGKHLAMAINKIALMMTMLLCLSMVHSGPVAYAACQTACNTGYATCMAASGLSASGTGPVGWYAWLTGAAGACSAVQGACMAACASFLVAPTP